MKDFCEYNSYSKNDKMVFYNSPVEERVYTINQIDKLRNKVSYNFEEIDSEKFQKLLDH